MKAIRRSGFTLLEVLLALGISVLLMGALYVSMDVQLNYAQAGRERVDDAVLARALLQKIRADVSSALTPITATQSTSSGGVGDLVAAVLGGGSDTPTATASLNAVTPFNGGIMGDVDTLTMFVSRVPGTTRLGSDADAAPNGGSDIRRVSYWLVADKGLACQDISRVTADDETTQLPPDVQDDVAAVIAPEVVGLEFHYFDGANWADSWDGTIVGADGVTPTGPPRAVKVVIGIKTPSGKVRTFTHVIAIQAANSQPPATTTTPTPETTE